MLTAKQKLALELDGLKTGEPLAPHTTFKIGGPAKFFYEAETIEGLKKAISICRRLKISYFILGGGSNALVSDKGFNGLIIKIKDLPILPASRKRAVAKSSIPHRDPLWCGTKFQIQNSRITASAGISLAKLLDVSLRAGLTGLEWAIGIPGTLGGAIKGNAGAFNRSMSDVIKRVWILRNGRLSSMSDYRSKSSYRLSPFAKTKDILWEAELRLQNGDEKESRQIARSYLRKRLSGQPTEFPSAGCVFKNLKFTTDKLKLSVRQYPEAEQFMSKKTVPAGWLIDKCGLKGKKIGGAMISEKHANFIVNAGGAKAQDVTALIGLIKKEAKKKFGVSLQEEIQYIGFHQ